LHGLLLCVVQVPCKLILHHNDNDDDTAGHMCRSFLQAARSTLAKNTMNDISASLSSSLFAFVKSRTARSSTLRLLRYSSSSLSLPRFIIIFFFVD
jgi:hypothetical protein